MSGSTFGIKRLRFTFTLSNNSVFAGTNSNILVVGGTPSPDVGLRATATIKGSGLPAFPEADFQVWGMKQDDMVALTALQFQPLGMQRNTVQCDASPDDGATWSTVFVGQIVTGGPDWSNMPDVPLNINARLLAFESLNPAPPTSYTGNTSVDSIVSTLAAKLGKTFYNNGVSVQLSNPYFGGTLAQQLRSVCQQAGIDCYNDPSSNVIEICPKGVPRNVPTFNLSPGSGLVSQPRLDYNRGFVNVRAYFNPALRFGGPVSVSGSLVPTANGSWVIGTIKNSLSSLMAGGPWFSDLLLYPPNSLPPIS